MRERLRAQTGGMKLTMMSDRPALPSNTSPAGTRGSHRFCLATAHALWAPRGAT